MSWKDEQIIRDYLESVRGPYWQTLPYDWMGMPQEYIDDAGFLPIPDEVFEAYEVTRKSSEDYDRDAKDYDKLVAGYENGKVIFVDKEPDQRTPRDAEWFYQIVEYIPIPQKHGRAG